MGYAKYVRPPWNDEEFVRNIAIEIKGLEYVLTEENYLAEKLQEEAETERRNLEHRQRNQTLDDKLDRFLE